MQALLLFGADKYEEAMQLFSWVIERERARRGGDMGLSLDVLGLGPTPSPNQVDAHTRAESLPRGTLYIYISPRPPPSPLRTPLTPHHAHPLTPRPCLLSRARTLGATTRRCPPGKPPSPLP